MAKVESIKSGEIGGAAERAANLELRGEGLIKVYGGRAVVDNVNVVVKPRRGGGIARTQRRRQDHHLLHAGRTAQARQGPRHVRRRRHHDAAALPARAPRNSVPAAGAERLPQADRRAESAGRARDAAAQRGGASGAPADRCSTSWVSRSWQNRRRACCPVASAAASRSRARWCSIRCTYASTSRSRESIRSRWSRFSASFLISRSAASAC